MNVLSLDISTKPGWALFLDGKLIRYGTLWADTTVEDHGVYPWNYVGMARHTAHRLYKEVIEPALHLSKSDLTVVIEETTGGSGNNYSQKKLEFIHYAVLEHLVGRKVVYCRDGSWKSSAGVKLNQEEKELNKKIKEYKEKTGEKLAKFPDETGKMRVHGRVTVQHVYIRRLREIFNIQLQAQEEDMAAAILMGHAFLNGVKLCDGVVKKNGQKKDKASKKIIKG